jgi:Glycosyltransferase
VERVMYECARYLRARGHEVNVFANEWEGDCNDGITFSYVPMRRQPFFLSGLSYFRRCTAALAKANFDVLNAHGCICPTGGVHWVHSVQRAWLERSKTFRPPLSIARLRQRINPLHPILLGLEREHFEKRKYRKVIALTENVRSDLNRFYGVPAEDVVVIPNGYSPAEFNPERRMERRGEMRLKLGLKPEDVALLFVAHELDRKGYATILSALQILDSQKLRLFVVGRNAASRVMKEAAKFGVEDQVIACGPTRDVAGYHAASDVFVLPTQYEAFCLAILEALGSGLPVVTTRIPGAEDAIQPGRNGFVIDDPKSGEQLAEALRLLLDEDCRSQLSNNASASVSKYQWDWVLEQYENVLRSACN